MVYNFNFSSKALKLHFELKGELNGVEMPLCSHNKTMAEALDMVKVQKDRLKQRGKKVLISIGATDLRLDRSFGDMKREFTELFMECESYGLKPLITSIYCIDTPELKVRADMFNGFLTKNFQNVVDMRRVGQYGLAKAIMMSQKQ